MRLMIGLVTAISLSATSTLANAQQVCAPRDTAVNHIEERFGEKVLGRGLAARGRQMIELFVSKTGSWTVLVSDPEGHSCVVASGQDWHGITAQFDEPA